MTRPQHMKRHFLVCLSFVSLLPVVSRAQSITRNFEFVMPAKKPMPSFYDRIEYMDSRSDTTRIGLVEVGPLQNVDAKFVLGSPIQPRLQQMLDSLKDSTAGHRTLLFQLRKFNYVETSGVRYCYFIAALYAREEAGYQKLGLMDTVLAVPSSHIPVYLSRKISALIGSFIAQEISLRPTDTSLYTYSNLQQIEDLEKQQIPLYHLNAFQNGIYRTYKSFSTQMPDFQGEITTKKDGSISYIMVLDSMDKKVKLKSKAVYAVVYKGLPYAATEYGYYPLEKIGNDFSFTGDVRLSASPGDLATAEATMGMIGYALASSGSRATYNLLIDHLTGNYIHLIRMIPKE